MTSGYQDNFKTLKVNLGKSLKNFRQEFAPDPSRLYDGKIDQGTQRLKLYSREFICSRCRGSSCFFCPDFNGEYYLACDNENCMYEEAERNKQPERKRFRKLLAEGKA